MHIHIYTPTSEPAFSPGSVFSGVGANFGSCGARGFQGETRSAGTGVLTSVTIIVHTLVYGSI